MLVDKAGLESKLVGGTNSSGEGHEWNIVKVDKKWYFVDCTWDIPSGPHIFKYFLKGEEYFSSNHILDKESVSRVAKLNVSKSNYKLPDSVFKIFAEANFKEKKVEYDEEVALLATGIDNYLVVKLGHFSEEEIDEYIIEMYKNLYQQEVEEYAVDFLTWLGGYVSEEEYIELCSINYKYSEYSGWTYTNEQKAKALAECVNKYEGSVKYIDSYNIK